MSRRFLLIVLVVTCLSMILSASISSAGFASAESCVIPPSGPWPPCAKGATAVPTPISTGCVIPPSGPWPPCAKGGTDVPHTPTPVPSGCVIPPSGPWPSCAIGGTAMPRTPTPAPSSCVIPPSGPWPPCAKNATPTPSSTTSPIASPTPPATGNYPYRNPALSIQLRLDDLMQRMTFDEKVGQMALVQQSKLQGNQAITTYGLGGVLTPDPQPTDNSAWGWYDVVNRFQQQALASRLAIPIFYGVDAVHGQARAWGTTIFPHNIGLGATNDADLVAKIGRITAQETAAMGINWSYDPVLAVPQDIRWGRTYESFSENTERVTRLGVAKLRGLQMSGLVLGTPKHFTADGGAQWGSSTWVGGGVAARIDRGNATLDEATLRSVHLAPYREAINQGAKSIMVSYSSWNGTKLHAHNYLLNTVLKGELGFSGFVVSDWGGIDFVASNQYDQIVTAINAGIDMAMLPNDYAGFTTNLKTAVARGDVSQNRVDDAVRRILRVKLEMGLFEHPMPNQSGLNNVGSAENRSIAREAVQKSAVLLKNEGDTLPIDKNTPLIFVAGDKANDIGKQSGGWTIQWGGVSGNWLKGTTIFGGMAELVKNRGTQLIYEATGNFPGTASADVCVVAVGENPYAEWRGDDGDLALESAEIALLQKVKPRCKKVVGVLISGRPMIITDQLPLMDALVAAWLPGSEGVGVADLLFGDQPFKGTLPFSWPRSIDQLPFNFALMQQKGCSNALFPYGFGLNVNSNTPPVCR